MTLPEVKDALVEALRGRSWVSVDEAIADLRALGVSRSAGDRILRDLCVVGRLEREPTAEGWPPRYQYRVVLRGSEHSGRARVERRMARDGRP